MGSGAPGSTWYTIGSTASLTAAAGSFFCSRCRAMKRLVNGSVIGVAKSSKATEK
jgi:hypothetical protein